MHDRGHDLWRIESKNCHASKILSHTIKCVLCACLGASLKMMNWNGVDDTRSTRYLTTGVTEPMFETKWNRRKPSLVADGAPEYTDPNNLSKTGNLFAFRAVAFLCSSCAFHNSNPSKNRRRTKNYRLNVHRRNRRWERRGKKIWRKSVMN